MTSGVLNVFVKEFRGFFNTPAGYIVLSIFFIGAGVLLWVFPGEYNVLSGGYADINGFFALAPWLFLFLCPAVTMRAIAEERQIGTLELLATKPISKMRLVFGKFLAAWAVIAVALLPAVLWFGSVYVMAEPMGNVDSGAFWGSFIGLLLLAAVYCAVGLFGSSLAGSQVTAFVVSALICFALFYGFELLASLFSDGTLTLYVKNLGVHTHYKSMSRGMLDSRDVLYMISVTLIFLIAAKMVLARRK